MKKYLECGKIVNTHGVRGAVMIESWCDSPEVLAKLPCVYLEKSGEYLPKKLLSAAVHKKMVLAEVEGIDDMDMAIAAKGKTVYADRADFKLSEDDFFLDDLIGLPVFDEISGKRYGEIVWIANHGASDIYTIKTENGEVMLPAVPEYVKRIDTERGVFITPIEGFFEE